MDTHLYSGGLGGERLSSITVASAQTGYHEYGPNCTKGSQQFTWATQSNQVWNYGNLNIDDTTPAAIWGRTLTCSCLTGTAVTAAMPTVATKRFMTLCRAMEKSGGLITLCKVEVTFNKAKRFLTNWSVAEAQLLIPLYNAVNASGSLWEDFRGRFRAPHFCLRAFRFCATFWRNAKPALPVEVGFPAW